MKNKMSKQSPKPSPTLSAIMCDGMGWFSEIDYKRMLLLYDEIFYLIPKTLVEFKDISGQRQSMLFPVVYRENPSFKVYYYEPDQTIYDVMFISVKNDISNDKFKEAVKAIPQRERLYTWRVTNADGDLGRGKSLELKPDQDVFAHGILLNKFLLAANHLNCIPITGKPYIRSLISEKYRASIQSLRANRPDLLPPSLKKGTIRLSPAASQIISSIVPDSELEKRTETEILKYKSKNKALFERFSYTIRQFVNKVGSLPFSRDFESEVEELISTEVWREQKAVEQELRSAWENFFKRNIKAVVGGLVGVGITPFLSLGSITIGSVIAAAGAMTPWATSELMKFLDKRKQAQQHGLYYLMKFTG